MPGILHIETSTKVCSVALSVDNTLLLYKESKIGESHAAVLGVYVEEVIKYVRSNNMTLDAVAVSSGPGSYTGLRIGVSEAKGLCYGLGIPLIAIPSLKILANAVIGSDLLTTNNNESVLLCPMIDARRMEVYASIYNGCLNEVREVRADIVDENTYTSYLESGKVLFFGDGADKCKSVINSSNAIFLENFYPMASAMVSLAENAYLQKDFVDVAYFEPFYLKEFQATVAKNKVIPQ